MSDSSVEKHQVGSDKEYLIGYHAREGMWIGYSPPDLEKGRLAGIAIQFGEGPYADGSVLSPVRMLEYVWKSIVVTEDVDGKRRGETVAEPPGWFERKCEEAGCGWFVPLVKRMAAGEDVPLEEIQAGYFAKNGEPMPSGDWRSLFTKPQAGGSK